MDRRTTVGTNDLGDDAAILDKSEGGNTADGSALGQVLFGTNKIVRFGSWTLLVAVEIADTYGELVNINLQENGIGVLLSEFIEDGSDLLARAAPGDTYGIRI